MKNTRDSSTLSLIAICLMVAAVMSFFLPLISFNFILSMSMSGFEAMIESIDSLDAEGILLLTSFVLCVIGLICALVGKNNNKYRAGTIVTATIGMVCMVLALSYEDDLSLKALDYAGIGFYLYEITCFLAAVVSAVAMHYHSGGNNSAVTPMNKTICPKCKNEQDEKAAFCQICGTRLDGNNSKPDSKIVCPACKKVVEKGAAFCPICGTSLSGHSGETGNRTVPAIKDGKVLCPYCGAKHTIGTAKCKYCSTDIY